MTSIRKRLLLWLLATLGVGLCAGGGAVYLAAGNTANEIADVHMRQIAGALPSRAFSPISVLSREDALEEHIVVQIWDRSGNSLYLSDRASLMPPRGDSGFATVRFAGADWRVYNETVGENAVQVAQPMRARTQMAAQVALRSVWPLMVMTPLLALAILLTVRRGLEPLDRIAHQVEQRSAESLMPISTDNTPNEVKALVGALNRLLDRLGHAFETQRAFVADAAHELRTPVAALKLQTQLAERAGNEIELRAALNTLHTGIDRAGHLIQQLLDLARQEESARTREHATCRLDELARQLVGERASLAIERGIDFGVAQADEVRVIGDMPGLKALMGNLLDNALNYTPSGGRVDVEVLREAGQALVVVSDSGPGIPAEHRARVFDRFYRVPGTRTSGSGLGLAIVQGAAVAHGAVIELSDRAGGGLRVSVRFTPEPAVG